MNLGPNWDKYSVHSTLTLTTIMLPQPGPSSVCVPRLYCPPASLHTPTSECISFVLHETLFCNISHKKLDLKILGLQLDSRLLRKQTLGWFSFAITPNPTHCVGHGGPSQANVPFPKRSLDCNPQHEVYRWHRLSGENQPADWQNMEPNSN